MSLIAIVIPDLVAYSNPADLIASNNLEVSSFPNSLKDLSVMSLRRPLSIV